jgi:hypothetical protein
LPQTDARCATALNLLFQLRDLLRLQASDQPKRIVPPSDSVSIFNTSRRPVRGPPKRVQSSRQGRSY